MTEPAEALLPLPSGPGEAAETAQGSPSLSPSRASDFMTCPLLYRFRVIDRIPEEAEPAPPPAAPSCTQVLERLFDLPAPSARSSARRLVLPQWAELLEAEPRSRASPRWSMPADWAAPGRPPSACRSSSASAGALLEQYFTLEDPQRLEPAERELRVEVELASGSSCAGSSTGSTWRRPVTARRRLQDRPGPGVGFEAKAMFQMRFYALVLWRAYGRVPRLLQLLYLGSGEVLRYEPDEADLRATEVKVKALWEAIARATETGDWRPSPSRLCDWCDHKSAVPRVGRQPARPPVPPGPHPPG
jgi:putative RecB family exonuclease